MGRMHPAASPRRVESQVVEGAAGDLQLRGVGERGQGVEELRAQVVRAGERRQAAASRPGGGGGGGGGVCRVVGPPTRFTLSTHTRFPTLTREHGSAS